MSEVVIIFNGNDIVCGGGGVAGVSLSLVSEVVGDNLGTVMSVLESVWGLLLGNLSLALSALTAAASLLLGGSLSILNALIGVVSQYSISFLHFSFHLNVYVAELVFILFIQ